MGLYAFMGPVIRARLRYRSKPVGRRDSALSLKGAPIVF